MTTAETLQKRQELTLFIERELEPNPAVQAVIGIGSIASGHAHAGSDIDAVVFLEPFDPYIIPAEFTWRPDDGTFHSIFSEVEGLQFDFARLDLARWFDPAHEWPEGRRAELADGWVAFDRSGQVAQLIAERAAYPEATQMARLDEAVTWLDQHLGDDGPEERWETLDPLIAHDRLHAAYSYLVQALFAYNRRWQPWRNREMSALLALPWLPEDFADRALLALNAPSIDRAGYMARVETLLSLFEDVLAQLVEDGVYGNDPIGEAFARSHDEPGRSWNMEAWNQEHLKRKQGV